MITFQKPKLAVGIAVLSVMAGGLIATHVPADENSGGHDLSLHCQHFPKDCQDNAADSDHANSGSAAANHGTTGAMKMPLSPGQDMFGAISEINSIIDSSGMRWTQVDLDALWEHLRDMDALMTDAVVTKTELENGLSMTVTGEGAAARAVENMIPTHASFLRSVRPDWNIEIEGANALYEVIVTASSASEIERIKALGFSGFMVQDDHHASHHLGIATGEVVH